MAKRALSFFTRFYMDFQKLIKFHQKYTEFRPLSYLAFPPSAPVSKLGNCFVSTRHLPAMGILFRTLTFVEEVASFHLVFVSFWQFSD